jgi:hypothetical protein
MERDRCEPLDADPLSYSRDEWIVMPPEDEKAGHRERAFFEALTAESNEAWRARCAAGLDG